MASQSSSPDLSILLPLLLAQSNSNPARQPMANAAPAFNSPTGGTAGGGFVPNFGGGVQMPQQGGGGGSNLGQMLMLKALMNNNQNGSSSGGGKGGSGGKSGLGSLFGGKGGTPLTLENYGTGLSAANAGLGVSDAAVAANLGSSMGDVGNLMSIFGAV